MMDMTSYVMRKHAKRYVLMYATIAATFAFLCAVDPEPLFGSVLVVFADTPFLTITTFTMIVHLCLYYGDRSILRDGLLTVAALSFGTVAGALGALLLGGLVPVLKTINNAIVTFGLHYATGLVVIDFLEKGNSIKNLTLDNLKADSKKYKAEGENYGKQLAEAQKRMSKEDKAQLKVLDKETREIAKKLRAELKMEKPESETVSSLTEEMEKYGKQMTELYAKYGFSMDD